MPKKVKMIREPRSPRGMVPAASNGALDIEYNSYLSELGVTRPDPPGTTEPKDTEYGRIIRRALMTCADQRFNRFLMYLTDPSPFWRRCSLATLAKKCEITPLEWAEFWSKAEKMRSLAIAQKGIVEMIPDMVAESRAQDVMCIRCDGWGWVDSETGLPGTRTEQIGDAPRTIRTCPECKGKGTGRKAGDNETRKMLLDMHDMTGKRAPHGVQITQNFGNTMGNAVDRLNSVSFEVDAVDVKSDD